MGSCVSHLCGVWGEIRLYVPTSMGTMQPGHWCTCLLVRGQGEMGVHVPIYTGELGVRAPGVPACLGHALVQGTRRVGPPMSLWAWRTGGPV